MSKPVRVLQVIGALGVGGAETWLMEVLRHWAGTGAGEMDFLLTSGQSGVFDEEARVLGASTHYVRYGRSSLGPFTRRFREILRSGRYDAVHDHADYASGWHFLTAVGAAPRVRVTHVHNPWLHIAANYAVSPARRVAARLGKLLVDRLATHVCGTSRQSLEEYGFHPGGTRPAVSVLHCGIDVLKFGCPSPDDRRSVRAEFGWSSDAKVVLFAGRLDRALEFDHPQNHKNSWFALHVARAAIARDPSIRLVVAGAGETRSRLEAEVSGWGLSNQIRLVGVRTDVPRLMHGADALLFPSRQEGLGMVAVEAQAAGLPVLASTAVPREAVVIPELFESRSLSETPEAWATALSTLISRPRLEPDAVTALMEVSPFSITTSARLLETVYRSAEQ